MMPEYKYIELIKFRVLKDIFDAEKTKYPVKNVNKMKKKEIRRIRDHVENSFNKNYPKIIKSYKFKK